MGTPPKSKPHSYWCKLCRKHFTVTTGTCLHATKQLLQDWIFTIYSVLTARKGVSALQLSKEVGCQYKTAWYMLHRIREACDQGSFILQEVVEADETFIGGKEGNKHASKKLHAGRGTVGKTPVAGVRQRDGRVVAKPVESTTAQTLSEFIESVVKRGSTVYTDDATAYQHLANVLNEYKKTLRLNIVKASMYVVKFIRVV
ncbi:MAG: IS1595 family transposase [Gammaproteobacteria bacterium]|nr:IS1595 family transposase [Gammaproteobacteria bacterium]